MKKKSVISWLKQISYYKVFIAIFKILGSIFTMNIIVRSTSKFATRSSTIGQSEISNEGIYTFI